MSRERILFVTGRLAEFSLRSVLEELQTQAEFDCDVAVLKIRVAALMNVDWLLRQLQVPPGVDRVILPGWCRGDLQRLTERFGVGVERGPKDLFDLPEFFGRSRRTPPALDRYDIEIVAEINDVPELEDSVILQRAESYRSDGADVIDLGCVPGQSCDRIGDVTRMLCDRGFRVSIDSFDRREVETAVKNGAELILSCTSENRDWIADLGTEAVVIPDDTQDLSTLEDTIAFLQHQEIRFRVDPILEPVGFGFAASVDRYSQVRRNWPDVEMFMGVGNLTELTEVDSAGINVLLAAICQELGIRSVLTTQVANWACSAVRELDVARRLVHHSVQCNVFPKHLDSRLVMLRDAKTRGMGEEVLLRLAAELKDRNIRIFVERDEIHIMNGDGYWRGTEPYELIERVLQGTSPLTPQHMFYLGYELAKAKTALTLGKRYVQDEALNWGLLTLPELSGIDLRKKSEKPQEQQP